MNLTHLTNFGEGRKNNKAITKTRRSLAIIDPSDCAVIDLIEETIEGEYTSAIMLNYLNRINILFIYLFCLDDFIADRALFRAIII